MLIPNSRVYRTIDDKKVVEVKTITEVDWDSFDVQYPSNTVEVYEFYKNSILKLRITLNYSDASKKTLLGGGREFFEL